jgi:hypothetical protein
MIRYKVLGEKLNKALEQKSDIFSTIVLGAREI